MALPNYAFLNLSYVLATLKCIPYGAPMVLSILATLLLVFSISLTAQAFQQTVRSRRWQPASVPLLWLFYGCPNFAYLPYGVPVPSLISCIFPIAFLWLSQPPCLLSSSPMAPLWLS